MVLERELQLALVVSLIAHALILAQSPRPSFALKKDKTREFEVRYIKKLAQDTEIERQLQARPAMSRLPAISRESFLDVSRVTPIAAIKPPPPFVQGGPSENIGNQQTVFNKPLFIKPELAGIKRKISLPALDMDKISNPSYISYYQLVREKIKRATYQNYTGSETGEVVVSFVISSEGYIKDIRLVEDKSLSGAYLRETALRSIKEAAPFPKFPKGLDYPQLTFNLAITFEIE